MCDQKAHLIIKPKQKVSSFCCAPEKLLLQVEADKLPYVN